MTPGTNKTMLKSTVLLTVLLLSGLLLCSANACAEPVDADPHDRLELQRLIGEDAIFKSSLELCT